MFMLLYNNDHMNILSLLYRVQSSGLYSQFCCIRILLQKTILYYIYLYIYIIYYIYTYNITAMSYRMQLNNIYEQLQCINAPILIVLLFHPYHAAHK